MAKILLVEDSSDFQYLVRVSLQNNYHLDVASNLQEARAYSDKHKYDLYLIDITLPDGSGYDFCTELQSNVRTRSIPIIFLTAKTSVTEKVIGFSLGADDYITKPFIAAELFARVEAKIKKMDRISTDNEQIDYGPFCINLASYELKINDGDNKQKINLTPNEFKILVKLIKNKEKVVSREQIIDSVWGNGTFIEDRTIDKHISSLRKKLGIHSQHLKTIPQLGYSINV